jgi:quercetin dioxygenase-like cupin family protein
MPRSPGKKDEVLDPAAIQMLGEALAPAVLSEEQRGSMRARIMERLADVPPARTETIRSGSIMWRKVSSGVEAKVLKRGDRVIIVLWRLEPGGVVPGHPHTEDEDEECFVVEGEMLLGTHCVRAGEFHIAKRGAIHEDLTTRTGCIVMVRSGISPQLAQLFPQ